MIRLPVIAEKVYLLGPMPGTNFPHQGWEALLAP
jgi:hypothetical protein